MQEPIEADWSNPVALSALELSYQNEYEEEEGTPSVTQSEQFDLAESLRGGGGEVTVLPSHPNSDSSHL